jgi:hypothetical protein
MNYSWGRLAINASRRNILLIKSKCEKFFIIKPQSLIIKPYFESFNAETLNYEKFLQFISDTCNCEYSSKHGALVIQNFWLKNFIQQIDEMNLTVNFSNNFFDKPLDYYCSYHEKEDFIILIDFDSYGSHFFIIPMLDSKNMVNLNHLYSKTGAIEEHNG